MTRRESLRRRLAIIRRDGMSFGLDGCPVGGWAETRQAMTEIADQIPTRDGRSYTVADLVDALYTVDHADRYRVRMAQEATR